MQRIETASPEETLAVGKDVAGRLEAGDLVLLRGPIGAGKSVLARGIGEALGVASWKGSPTFTLVNEYETCPRLYHIDLYRLSEPEAQDLGLEEYVREDAVAVVEWADRAPGLLQALAPGNVVWIDIAAGRGDRREIVIYPPGSVGPAAVQSS